MKKAILILSIIALSVSCKNKTDQEKTPETELSSQAKEVEANKLFKGEFVYYNGAAVLQTTSEIYGVLLSDKLDELQKLAEKHKKAPTDMVLVELKVKVTQQKHETILWDNKLEIEEIIAVMPVTQDENNTIKLGS